MFTPGHYGMALLCYAVVAYALLARGYRLDALGGASTVLAFTLHPDLDSQLPLVVHRGLTHTLWFAALVGALCVVVLAADIRKHPRPALATSWAFGLGALSILAHLFADALNPWGIAPLAPAVTEYVSLNVVYASNDAANVGLLCAGVAAALVAWRAGTAGADRDRAPVGRALFDRLSR